jgi:concentrative nucleoside transporter, CNT family
VQILYNLGIMQWVIKHFVWIFFKVMNVSSAEAVKLPSQLHLCSSAKAGSACLVKPYVDIMTSGKLFRE